MADSCRHPINTSHNRRITRKRAAVIANANIGNVDVFEVAAIDDQRVTAADTVTYNDPMRTINVHSSPHQFERFVDRHIRRCFAAVVNNVTVLGRTVGWRMFRAERTRGQLPSTIDQPDRRGAALVAMCGLGASGFHQFATGPADRAVAIQSMR